MKRPRTGYTLFEILIVIVVLSILAAIVIPQFTATTNPLSPKESIKVVERYLGEDLPDGDPTVVADYGGVIGHNLVSFLQFEDGGERRSWLVYRDEGVVKIVIIRDGVTVKVEEVEDPGWIN